MKVTMIGHSTVLIEAAEMKILTDPYFGSWGNLAYKRIAPPFKTREQMLAVDLVLVSHNHWDHTDSRYFRALAPSVPVVSSARGGMDHPFASRAPCGWPRGYGSRSSLAPFALPRRPHIHLAIPCGFVLEAEEKAVYFAGDTYYGGFMKADRCAASALDLALIPVTTFRIPMTMGEKRAVLAVEKLWPKIVIPIHLGIQPRSPLLRTGQTPEGFSRRVREAGLQTEVVTSARGRELDQSGLSGSAHPGRIQNAASNATLPIPPSYRNFARSSGVGSGQLSIRPQMR